MAYLEIKGGNKLYGEIPFEAAKNSVLPILAATLMVRDKVYLRGVPRLSDIEVMERIMSDLNCKITEEGCCVRVSTVSATGCKPSAELAGKLRASCFLLGPALSIFGEAELPMPGGCKIGARPLDLHFDGLRQLGFDVEESDRIVCRRGNAKAGTVVLRYPSVGATENLITAACGLQGETTIIGAAREPEIKDLADFINACGGYVRGAGGNMITVRGAALRGGICYKPISDRIASGTYLAAGAVCGGEVTVNCNKEQLGAAIIKLTQSTCQVRAYNGKIMLKSKGRLKSFGSLITEPYPGFPTDLQAPFTAVSAVADGVTTITERVFENRFSHVPELVRMGAAARIDGDTVTIDGTSLHGAEITAYDLRGGAALAIAALCAEGVTVLNRPDYIDRGYQLFTERLCSLGGNVKRNER